MGKTRQINGERRTNAFKLRESIGSTMTTGSFHLKPPPKSYVYREFSYLDDDSLKYADMLRKIVKHNSWESNRGLGLFKSVPASISSMRKELDNNIIFSEIPLIPKFSKYARKDINDTQGFEKLSSNQQESLKTIARWDEMSTLNELRQSIDILYGALFQEAYKEELEEMHHCRFSLFTEIDDDGHVELYPEDVELYQEGKKQETQQNGFLTRIRNSIKVNVEEEPVRIGRLT